MKIKVFSLIFITSIPFYTYSSSDSSYVNDINATHERLDGISSKYIKDKINNRSLHFGGNWGNTQFGLHGMETPFISYKGDLKKQDEAFSLISRAGVDTLRSSEGAWHRIADSNGNPRNLNELKYQLSEGEKFKLSHLFVIGYPPGKFTVSGDKLSAVKPQFYKQYKDYLYILMHALQGHEVNYLELGNEVDAPNVWWKKSTPEMYVNEMRMVKSYRDKYLPNTKLVAFASTYSRDDNLGGENGGVRFVQKAINLGIDKYTDTYSLHHFSFKNFLGFPEKFRALLKANNINKPLIDTEQLDKVQANFNDSRPYDIIKMFARGFFVHKLSRIDYYLAKDTYLNNKLYSIGLFDLKLNPKPRLLAYAMAVDSMKGRTLKFMASPVNDSEAYILINPKGVSKYRYTILVWRNINVTSNKKYFITSFDNNSILEKWNLDKIKLKSDYKIYINYEPVAIYTNTLPNWKVKSISSFRDKENDLSVPLP